MAVLRTLTDAEQRQLLRVTLEHREGLRDHVIILMALKTGLREMELCALNIGDVFETDAGAAKVRRLLILHTYKNKVRAAPGSQCVGLEHDGLRDKLAKLYSEKVRAGHDMSPQAPLFVRRRGGGRKSGRVDRGGRLTERALRSSFVAWQEALGWNRDTTRFFRFHDLRHTACSRYYRVQGKDLMATKNFARHKSVVSTQIYTHITDEEHMQALKRM